MIQFLADNVDQLDLALDQLAVGDRNFDRFSLMLIDNVVELTLHKFVQGKALQNREALRVYTRLAEMRQQISATADESEESRKLIELETEQKIIKKGLGQSFDYKIKAASKLGLIDSTLAETLLELHSYRNSAYHKGLRHESILHSLTVFYFRNACTLLKAYQPTVWSWSSSDKLSHRAMKYLGKLTLPSNPQKVFSEAYSRLDTIAETMSENLIGELSSDFLEVIESTDESIDFLSKDAPYKSSRDEVIIDAQLCSFIRTDEAKEFAKTRGCTETDYWAFRDWIAKNYNWPFRLDPIPAWRKRHERLTKEKDYHKALNRYCEFMRQTEDLREQINESAAMLDMYIQHEIDAMRGK